MASRGFTLFELLVVLAVIGLVLATIPGFVLRDNDRIELEAAVRELAAGLSEARSEALLTNREQAFALDVETRRFRIARDRPLRQLDPELEVAFQTARSTLLAPSAGSIRFFPDGSSTGGRIELARGPLQTAVSVDWLTGEVDVRPVGARDDG
ncbi:MAG: GspH/FimT family pseudopilin [Geminicoccaceae bacterium]|nr:GspH/FimT family pseudopilin [Geminicoccaceae bacterium]